MTSILQASVAHWVVWAPAAASTVIGTVLVAHWLFSNCMYFFSHLIEANRSQLPPQTTKFQKATLTKTPVHLLLCAKTAVTNCSKLIPGKPTGIFSRKTQKVIHVAKDYGIDPILRENMLAFRRVLLLLACLLSFSFPAMIGPPPLCIQYFKLAPDVITCLKQTKYHACGRCNRLHKPCLKVWPSRFGYV